ncbi:MAG TPA: response regulator, partial [Hyphomicrobium sp.]|nr:response regulator [Hyphomicrobium sp.]
LLSELVPLVRGHQGVIYQMVNDGNPYLKLLGKYADHPERGYPKEIGLGDGFIGQCAVEKRRILITDIPENAVRVGPSLVEALPRNIVVLPVIFEDNLKAVIAVASLYEFDKAHLSLLEQITASIGIVLNSIEATMQTEGLLKQSQELAGELQAQQRELQKTNEQLEQKAQQLAERNVEVEAKNQEIEHARRALEEKATELALTSKYKSEFLANMSHELRTPLNSILILGQQLSENADGNLSDRQVEFARTIHGAGSDLLNLISDILDLSKIESGTVSVDAEELYISNLLDTVGRPFRHMADTRELEFMLTVDPLLESTIVTDSKRLQQVLKNLLSNAFKFTTEGGVRLSASVATSGWNPDHPILSHASGVVAFEVADTGIGILPEKQKIIFEAFQQADASTSRKYGGTGLGLAISRELAALLGGEIQLRSTPGVGSTFTLFLPQKYIGPLTFAREEEVETAVPAAVGEVQSPRQPERAPEPIADDRDNLNPGEAVLLVVEDDPHYARTIMELAHDHGFKVIVAQRGTDALTLATEFNPDAVSLDVFLPDMLGWSVLSQLKQNPLTRHIPVQMVTLDENRQHGLAQGAFAFHTKPTSVDGLREALTRIKTFTLPRRRQLLVVEDSEAEQMGIRELLGHDDIDIATVSGGHEALEYMRNNPCDCVVLDLKLPDMTGFDVLEAMAKDEGLAGIPVVVFTGRELSAEDDARLHTMARSVVVKGVESPERLLDETALFLHRVVGDLPRDKQRMLERLHACDDNLVDRTVLLVDDDARNIFALSSVLERRGMRVLTATTGKEAIESLSASPDVSIVLMDIMMPDMDGYETMQAIRADGRWGRLPIVALTAKAMKGDREKCLQAGATDYLAKPVNTEQLLAALRTWLHR